MRGCRGGGANFECVRFFAPPPPVNTERFLIFKYFTNATKQILVWPDGSQFSMTRHLADSPADRPCIIVSTEEGETLCVKY